MKKPTRIDWQVLYNDASKMRDEATMQLRRAEARIRAMGECASAASALLAIGDDAGASIVLTTVRRSYLDSMREKVALEPGGVAWRVGPEC